MKIITVCALALSLGFVNVSFADHKADHHTSEKKHSHQHKKDCGHKAEKHGDHTDYEHEVGGKMHHHKKHGKHFDECEGPEGEAAAKEPAKH